MVIITLQSALQPSLSHHHLCMLCLLILCMSGKTYHSFTRSLRTKDFWEFFKVLPLICWEVVVEEIFFPCYRVNVCTRVRTRDQQWIAFSLLISTYEILSMSDFDSFVLRFNIDLYTRVPFYISGFDNLSVAICQLTAHTYTECFDIRALFVLFTVTDLQ